MRVRTQAEHGHIRTDAECRLPRGSARRSEKLAVIEQVLGVERRAKGVPRIMSVVGSPFMNSDGAARSIHPLAVCVVRTTTRAMKVRTLQRISAACAGRHARVAPRRPHRESEEHQVARSLPVRQAGVTAERDQRERRNRAGAKTHEKPARRIARAGAQRVPQHDHERNPNPREHGLSAWPARLASVVSMCTPPALRRGRLERRTARIHDRGSTAARARTSRTRSARRRTGPAARAISGAARW